MPNWPLRLSYALGWVSRHRVSPDRADNAFVAFHSMQSVVVFGVLSLSWFVLVSIPFIGWMLAIFVLIPASASCAAAALQGLPGERFKVPVAGDMADRGYERVDHRAVQSAQPYDTL